MWWAIILLMVAGVFIFFAGTSDKFGELLSCLSAGGVVGVIGSIMLYYSGFGNPCVPGMMAVQPIYAVSGRVETSRGAVFVVEDAQMNVFCIWGEANDSQPTIPGATKLLRVNTERPVLGRYLEPVDKD